MKIKEIVSAADKEKYSELAKKLGNIFNSLEWLDIFSDKVKFFGIYEDDGKLVGGFPLFKEKKFGLNIYQNPPFSPSIGPIMQVDAQNQVAIMDKWKEVLKLVAELIDSLPYSIVLLSLDKKIVDTQPFIWRKFKINPCYTYVLDLNKSIEEIQKEMSKERRNDISKALKDSLISKKVNDVKEVKLLINKTFLRQNKKIKEYYLDKILFNFSNDSNSYAFVTFEGEKPIAASFCIYDRDTAYYLLGGYDDKSKHHGAGALAMWEAIKYAKELGIKYFDFEGSMVPQIEKYFRGFGGKLTPYYKISKARLFIEIILKFFKRGTF